MSSSRRRFLQSVAGAMAAASALRGTRLGAAPAPVSGSLSIARQSDYKLDLGGYTGPELTDQPLTLRLMRQVYPQETEAWWKDIYAQWAEGYPNITIQEEQVPYGDLNTKMQTYVAAGDAPDIMMGKGDFVQAYVFNDIALNLSDYLSQAFIDDLTAATKAQQMVDGKLYAAPWEHNQVMIEINKDLFEKAGVTPPPETPDVSGAWTWDQFNEACQQLTAGLNSGDTITTWALASSTFGNGGPGSSYWLEGMYTRSLGDPNAEKDSSLYKTFAAISDDGLTASGYVDTPEAIQGMTFYQNIFAQKFSPTVPVPDQFESGQAAMRFGGISTAIRFKNPANTPPFKYGFAPPPKGNIVFTHTSGDTPFIWSQTQHPAEAAAFLAFLTNDPNRISWHKTWGMTPARTSLFDKIGYDDQVGKLAIDLTKHGYPPPITPGYLEYFQAMNTAVKDIALGADPEQRLHEVAKQIDELLSNYRS
jgi:multiple sugar transport system substrate-binding protein